MVFKVPLETLIDILGCLRRQNLDDLLVINRRICNVIEHHSTSSDLLPLRKISNSEGLFLTEMPEKGYVAVLDTLAEDGRHHSKRIFDK